MALFYIFASLVNVWLHRRQLHSICFFIQSITIKFVGLFEVYEECVASHIYVAAKIGLF